MGPRPNRVLIHPVFMGPGLAAQTGMTLRGERSGLHGPNRPRTSCSRTGRPSSAFEVQAAVAASVGTGVQ